MTTDKDIAQLLRPICIELAEGVRKGCECIENNGERWIQCAKVMEHCQECIANDDVNEGAVPYTDCEPYTNGYRKCPTCTPRYNQLMELADKLCVHKDIKWQGCRTTEKRNGMSISFYRCPACGLEIEGTQPEIKQEFKLVKLLLPQFSIEPIEGYISLVEVLRVLGMWEEFVKWHTIQSFPVFDDFKDLNFWRTFLSHEVSAEILTDKELLKTAISSFVRREE
jgi:hypothetical protein